MVCEKRAENNVRRHRILLCSDLFRTESIFENPEGGVYQPAVHLYMCRTRVLLSRRGLMSKEELYMCRTRVLLS